jgi:hypothetical protein
VDLAAEDEVEIGGRLVFDEDEVAIGCDTLSAVSGDPSQLVVREAFELDDGAECGDDLG